MSDRHKINVEDIRTFFVRRKFLCGPDEVISADALQSLIKRDGVFWNGQSDADKAYLKGFVDGWQDGRV